VASEPGQGAEFFHLLPDSSQAKLRNRTTGNAPFLKGARRYVGRGRGCCSQMLVQTAHARGLLLIGGSDGSERLCKWRQERTPSIWFSPSRGRSSSGGWITGM